MTFRRHAARELGFSLMEVLVALAVLAIAMAALDEISAKVMTVIKRISKIWDTSGHSTLRIRKRP